MAGACPTCKKPNCGNHAACARRVEDNRRKFPQPRPPLLDVGAWALERNIEAAATAMEGRLIDVCKAEFQTSDGNAAIAAWMVAHRLERRLFGKLPPDVLAMVAAKAGTP